MGEYKTLTVHAGVTCHSDCPTYPTLSAGHIAVRCAICGRMKSLCMECVLSGRLGYYYCDQKATVH